MSLCAQVAKQLQISFLSQRQVQLDYFLFRPRCSRCPSADYISSHIPLSAAVHIYGSFVLRGSLEFHEPVDCLRHTRLAKVNTGKGRAGIPRVQNTRGHRTCSKPSRTLNKWMSEQSTPSLLDPVTVNVSVTSSDFSDIVFQMHPSLIFLASLPTLSPMSG